MADYLFPIPAGPLRSLLHFKAEFCEPGSAEFTDDEAAADVMLDLDRMRHPNPRLRLRKLHTYRYYGERWGWPKTRVAEAFAGNKKRGLDPWIVARAEGWRAFRDEADDARPCGQPADSGGQGADKKPPYDEKQADLRTAADRVRTPGGQRRTELPELQTTTPSPARAREDGDSPGDPVATLNQTYAAVPEGHPYRGHRAGIMQEDRIRASVRDAGAWADFLRGWAESEYSPRNLDKLLRAFGDFLARSRQPDAGDGRGTGEALPDVRRAPQEPNRSPSRRGRPSGLRATAEHRKSASDRRSEYGWDDASRDVDDALADLIAADEARRDAARRGATNDGGRDDG